MMNLSTIQNFYKGPDTLGEGGGGGGGKTPLL